MKLVKSETRKIIQSGSSRVVTIPPAYLDLNDLELKDEVRVRWKDDILEIKPVEENHSEVGVNENGGEK